MSDEYLLAQGQAKLATEEDLFRDASGITYPNLHRRIDKDLAPRFERFILKTAEGDILLTSEGQSIVISVDITSLESLANNGELPPRKEDYDYTLLVQGVNSYRNVKITNIDPESEVP